MLGSFIRFELRFWLKGWMVWIFLLIIGTLIFGATSSDRVQVGGPLGNAWRNASWVILSFYSIMAFFTLLMTTAFVNSAASRDFQYNTHLMMFASPLRRRDYLLGRFLGAVMVAVIPMLGISLGIIMAGFMPWIDAERWGPILWRAHLEGILVFAIPNTLFSAAFIFAIAVWTRSTIGAFIGALVFLTGYTVADVLTQDIERETYAMLLDPLGVRTFSLLTKYWTAADKNTSLLNWPPMLVANRLLWLAVSAGIFALAAWRFSFSERAARPSRWRRQKLSSAGARPSRAPLPPLTVTEGGVFTRLWGTVRNEFSGLVRSVSFIIITLAALLNCVPSLIYGATEMYGNSTAPVTYAIVEVIQGTLTAFMLGMITFYAGVLVWRERDANMADIHDALPSPSWITYAGKLMALLGSLLIVITAAAVAGVLVQRGQGFPHHDWGLYGAALYLREGSLYLLLAVLAFFCHVVSPNKYVGYFAFVGFWLVNIFIWQAVNVATRLVRYASRPQVQYSDFFGYQPDWGAWSAFTLYWLLFAGVLTAGSLLLWQRGRDTHWSARWRNAGRRFSGPLRVFALGAAAAFTVCAGWLYYNTKVINTVTSADEADDRAADYEKKYKRHEKNPQPRVTAVRHVIDIYPETRNASMKVEQQIVNRHPQPLTEMHVTLPRARAYDLDLKIDGMTMDWEDARLRYRVYKINPPMQPGEKRMMRYTQASRIRGVANEIPLLQFAQNGTFFDNTIGPQIGYQSDRELTSRTERKKRGLKEKALFPPLERNCAANCMNNYLSTSSDWVTVDTVISTIDSQLAIAPGSLVREWRQDGRRYFEYKLDHPSLNFYSFMSANYQVARENWNGVSIEIYYLEPHARNVPKMIRGVRQALEYYTTHFGPYKHKQARIIEFPRVAQFAQAFPGTMPYSESIGFMAKLDKPDDIDQVFYIVAHEMAHQWWAHQVMGAAMQGATLLSETLSQYSALMVMEKQFGRDMMRKFLRYEMDRYLRGRGMEQLRERPLINVDGSQGYIHYQKGSVVMYYLKEMIGEEAVNRALRKLVERYAYAEPPYPTAHHLVDLLRAETPPDLQYLIKDLFEDMTLFSNRTLQAKSTKRPDGKFDVEIRIEAKKFKADDKGAEKEVAVNDWIEIGAFAKAPAGKKYGATLHRERVRLTAAQSTHKFTVAQEPYEAGVDPFLLLVDRFPDDNLKKLAN